MDIQGRGSYVIEDLRVPLISFQIDHVMMKNIATHTFLKKGFFKGETHWSNASRRFDG